MNRKLKKDESTERERDRIMREFIECGSVSVLIVPSRPTHVAALSNAPLVYVEPKEGCRLRSQSSGSSIWRGTFVTRQLSGHRAVSAGQDQKGIPLYWARPL